jgi:hypothetical protein
MRQQIGENRLSWVWNQPGILTLSYPVHLPMPDAFPGEVEMTARVGSQGLGQT